MLGCAAERTKTNNRSEGERRLACGKDFFIMRRCDVAPCIEPIGLREE